MRKQLFHFSQLNSYQFVTFRTQASIDDYLLRMKDSQLEESKKQLAMDKYLDTSDKGRLLNNEVIKLVIDYCKNLEPKLYQLICLSVMPNHIHILFEQKQNMGAIMQQLKGGLAFKINQQLNLKGSLWERNYFDKTIRDEKHLQVTYDYIKNNAYKAKLLDAEKRFYSVHE
jgi:REP element-mobilizing transposase RayT